ncbi:MAG: calcium/sodium antiporter, partial [Planctomycetota bacterium]
LGEDAVKADRSPARILKALFYVALGGLGLWLGSTFLVDGSQDVAQHFGVPEFVVGMTIVAIGTSVPELAFSVRAAQQGHPELVLGNVIGSNAFNLLCVLGIAGIVDPIRVPEIAARREIWIMLAATVLIWLLMVARKKFSRAEGVVLLIAYAAYMVFVITT